MSKLLLLHTLNSNSPAFQQFPVYQRVIKDQIYLVLFKVF